MDLTLCEFNFRAIYDSGRSLAGRTVRQFRHGSPSVGHSPTTRSVEGSDPVVAV